MVLILSGWRARGRRGAAAGHRGGVALTIAGEPRHSLASHRYAPLPPAHTLGLSLSTSTPASDTCTLEPPVGAALVPSLGARGRPLPDYY